MSHKWFNQFWTDRSCDQKSVRNAKQHRRTPLHPAFHQGFQCPLPSTCTKFHILRRGHEPRTWLQQLLFLHQGRLVPLDRNSWYETHRRKALFKDTIWHAKCPGCTGNNLLLTMVNSSPFFLKNNPGLSVALYKWSWMGIFRSRTWMRNNLSGSKISSSQWLHSKHPFSHSWSYLKHLMPPQRHSSFSWAIKAKVQHNNLKWSELFLQQGPQKIMRENCSFIRNYHTALFQCLQVITMYSSWKTKTYVPRCYLESHLYHLSTHCIASSSSHPWLARKLVSGRL